MKPQFDRDPVFNAFAKFTTSAIAYIAEAELDGNLYFEHNSGNEKSDRSAGNAQKRAAVCANQKPD